MRTVLLVLHVVAAIFLIGPLVFLANRAAGALRGRESAGWLEVLAKAVPVYGWASLLVAVLGFGLVREEWGNEITDGWLLGSVVLWLVATALVLGVLAPMLRRAVGGPAGSAAALAPRAAAVGGLASLAYVAVAVLMVWQPR